MCDNYYTQIEDLMRDYTITVKNGYMWAEPKSEEDIWITKSESSLTIDGGNITTDSVSLYKLVEFCDSNNIKLNIINGRINLNVWLWWLWNVL